MAGFLLVFGLILSSCSLDDDGVNFHYEPLQILEVELPESFDLYQVYTINLTVLRSNDCTLMEGFDVRRTDTTTRVVTAIGAILEKEDCETVDQEIQDSFQFEVRYTDTYLFRFYTGDDGEGNPEYLEVEVPVNQTAN